MNPFLPVHVVNSQSRSKFTETVLRGLLLGLIAVRIPALLLWTVLCGIIDLLFMVPILSALIVRPVLRPLVCHIGLLILGQFLNPRMKVDDFRRLRLKRPVNESYNPGKLTFSQYSGFIDILAHGAVTQPSAFAFKSREKSWTVYRSVLLAIYACRDGVTSVRGNSIVPPNAVVFVQSVPTNSLGILKLDESFLGQLSKGKPFQLTKVNYYSGTFAPHHVVGSFTAHILSLLLRNSFTTVSVVCLPEPLTDTDQISSMLSRLSEPVPQTQISEESYHDFISYWKETQKISYVKK